MSDKLPIILSAQIASGDIDVEVIGVAQGTANASAREHQKSFEKANSLMHVKARELGGHVVIDPQISTAQHESWFTITMFCRVGKLVNDDAEGKSE